MPAIALIVKNSRFIVEIHKADDSAAWRIRFYSIETAARMMPVSLIRVNIIRQNCQAAYIVVEKPMSRFVLITRDVLPIATEQEIEGLCVAATKKTER